MPILSESNPVCVEMHSRTSSYWALSDSTNGQNAYLCEVVFTMCVYSFPVINLCTLELFIAWRSSNRAWKGDQVATVISDMRFMKDGRWDCSAEGRVWCANEIKTNNVFGIYENFASSHHVGRRVLPTTPKMRGMTSWVSYILWDIQSWCNYCHGAPPYGSATVAHSTLWFLRSLS